MIGPDPATNSAGVASADPVEDLLPHQVTSWIYYNFNRGWLSDPLLTVAGNNININIFKSVT